MQEELKGKLRANDPNLKEIVDKILQIQLNIDKNNGQRSLAEEIGGGSILRDGSTLVPSLEYYLIVAADLAKLIRNLLQT